KAFLADVAASKKYALKHFKGMLHPFVLEDGLTEEERSRRLDALAPGVDQAARKLFYDYVFAETFDSFFCSAKTRASLTSHGVFSRTGKAFAPVGKEMISLKVEKNQ